MVCSAKSLCHSNGLWWLAKWHYFRRAGGPGAGWDAATGVVNRHITSNIFTSLCLIYQTLTQESRYGALLILILDSSAARSNNCRTPISELAAPHSRLLFSAP